MTTRRFRLDDLVGRMVRDAEGRSVGRVYDMRAEERNGESRKLGVARALHGLAAARRADSCVCA